MMQECIEEDEREGRIGEEGLEQRRGKVKEQEARETYRLHLTRGCPDINLSADWAAGCHVTAPDSSLPSLWAIPSATDGQNSGPISTSFCFRGPQSLVTRPRAAAAQLHILCWAGKGANVLTSLGAVVSLLAIGIFHQNYAKA
jgi:hypothetical protein